MEGAKMWTNSVSSRNTEQEREQTPNKREYKIKAEIQQNERRGDSTALTRNESR